MALDALRGMREHCFLCGGMYFPHYRLRLFPDKMGRAFLETVPGPGLCLPPRFWSVARGLRGKANPYSRPQLDPLMGVLVQLQMTTPPCICYVCASTSDDFRARSWRETDLGRVVRRADRR